MTFLQRLCAGAGAGVGAGGPPERDNSCAFKSFATLSEAVLPLRDAPFRAAWAPDGSGRCRLRQEPEPSLFSGAAMLGRAVMGAIAAEACGQPAKANTRAAPIAMLFRARFIGHSVRSLVSANVRFHISGGYQSKRIVQMGPGNRKTEAACAGFRHYPKALQISDGCSAALPAAVDLIYPLQSVRPRSCTAAASGTQGSADAPAPATDSAFACPRHQTVSLLNSGSTS